MSSLKAASLALAVVAGTGLLLGTFGFSAASADRGVSVAVAEDENAMVGYQSSDLTVETGTRVGVVTVTNRLPGEVEVTDVSVDAWNVAVTNVSRPSLSAGTAEPIEGTVSCTPGETETVEVAVTLEGSGVNAAISGDVSTREFELSCTTE